MVYIFEKRSPIKVFLILKAYYGMLPPLLVILFIFTHAFANIGYSSLGIIEFGLRFGA